MKSESTWSLRAVSVLPAVFIALIGDAAVCHAAARPGARVEYVVRLSQTNNLAQIEIRVEQSEAALKRLDFRPKEQRDPSTRTGALTVSEGRWRWEIPARGGTLRFIAPIGNVRANGSVDADMNQDWGLFRGDDLVPSARSTFSKGSEPSFWLKLELPQGWSMATPYGRQPQKWLAVSHPNRRFDRPTGWFIVGDIGLRTDVVAGSQVWIAGPKGQGVRRLDMLAMVRWTLPTLAAVFGQPPDPLLVVSAGDPFFRGGLAAPTSLFMHADRPLISENGTSSLVHELVHLMLPPAQTARDDWIVEGLAEFYSVESLLRSGSTSRKRYNATHEMLAAWGRGIRRLDRGPSTGAETARAVSLFKSLDEELRPEHSLDAVAAQLAKAESLTKPVLLQAITAAAGTVPPRFQRELDRLTE